MSATNYDELVSGASKIANHAYDMQTYLLEAYFKIGEMINVWFGEAYDTYVDLCNMAIPGLNGIFASMVSSIPDELYAKTRAYAGANQTIISSSYRVQTAIILKDIPKSGKGTVVRFQEEKIREYQEKIEDQFTKAITSAESAKKIAEELDWDDVDGSSNIITLIKAVGNLKKITKNLSSVLKLQIITQYNSIKEVEGTINVLNIPEKLELNEKSEDFNIQEVSSQTTVADTNV